MPCMFVTNQPTSKPILGFRFKRGFKLLPSCSPSISRYELALRAAFAQSNICVWKTFAAFAFVQQHLCVRHICFLETFLHYYIATCIKIERQCKLQNHSTYLATYLLTYLPAHLPTYLPPSKRKPCITARKQKDIKPGQNFPIDKVEKSLVEK